MQVVNLVLLFCVSWSSILPHCFIYSVMSFQVFSFRSSILPFYGWCQQL